MSAPTWITNTGTIFIAEEFYDLNFQFEATGDNLEFFIISGKLPDGLVMSSSGLITGIPDPVLKRRTSKIVVRVKNPDGLADRTFDILIVTDNPPSWITESGYLSLGPSNEMYCYNNQWVNFQFNALPTDAPPDTKLEFFIASNQGALPPGLILSKDGVLSGFIKDNLNINDNVDPELGYDFRAFDSSSYDYYVQSPATTHVPKIYQFKITVTDSVASSERLFKILVVDTEILENNITSLPDDITLPFQIKYLQTPQFIQGESLGSIRASNNHIISVEAYDPEPNIGTLTYSLSGRIPEGLSLDTTKGYLYGYIPYQPAYSKTYSFEIVATKKLNTITVSKIKPFTLTIKGEVESTIEWITDPDLGNLTAGQPSEIGIEAKHLASEYNIKYSIIDGNLPVGLSLKNDGSISGSSAYSSTGTFSFTARASDVYNLSAIERTFSLNILPSTKEYTKIYVRPFLPQSDRRRYQEFISDSSIFPPRLIYRYFDPNFGIQSDIKCILQFGIEKLNLRNYTIALRENFYKRKFNFGQIKIATAKTKSGQILYEVIYADIVDNLVNNQGISVSEVVYTEDNIYYPASLENMKKQLETLVLPSFEYIDVDQNYQPKFLREMQEINSDVVPYTRIMPICYALPGNGKKILERIKLSNFNFNTIDFEVDRIIIENSADNTSTKYLLFERKSITDSILEDSYLFGPEETFYIETEDQEPLIRE